MTEITWHDDWTPGRRFLRLPVCSTLGGDLTLPLHVATGAKPGPTLAITAAVHGDETTPAMMIRDLLDGLDLTGLTGRIVAVPVCNPPSVSNFGRQTPEQHGKTDLHEVFPGNPHGNLTQMIAAVLAEHVIKPADVLIDYHCGGSGGRLQERVDIHRDTDPALRAKSLQLARAFGTVLIHDNALAGTAVGYANASGKIAFNAETSGVYLAPTDQDGYIERGVDGFRSVMCTLGMIQAGALNAKRQLVFPPKARHEANPQNGGYLISQFQCATELGKPVKKGTLLGTMVDIHTLQVAEELLAPVDGLLVFSRYSGAVDAGTKSFALAETAQSEWLEP
jgi:predicted deacylase